MSNHSIRCFVCGSPTLQPGQYPQWRGECAIIQLERSSNVTIKEVRLSHSVTHDPYIGRYPQPFAAFRDSITGDFGPQVNILPAGSRSNRGKSLGLPVISGFVTHISCWRILESLLSEPWKRTHLDPDHMNKYLYTLYQILDSSPYKGFCIKWPHKFLCGSPKNPHSEKAEKRKYLRKELDANPLEYGFCSLRRLNYRYGDDEIPFCECLGQNDEEPSEDHLCPSTQPSPSHHGPISIPNFLPFPPELVAYILSFLDLSEITKLATIKTKRRVEIADIVWKHALCSDEDLGYLCFDNCRANNDHHSQRRVLIPQRNSWNEVEGIWGSYRDCWVRDRNLYSWHEVLELAKYYNSLSVYTQWHGMGNRQRIWKLCKGLADQVRDIADSKNSFLDPILPLREEGILSTTAEDIEKQVKFCVQSGGLQPWTEDDDRAEDSGGVWAQYKAETPKSLVKHVVLYYAGSGDYMRYVCGIQLLPAGDSIGYITAHRRIIELEGKEALTVAMSRFGLLDISISKEADSPNWLNGRQAPDRYFDTVTQSRILFRQASGKIRELKVSAKLDAAKIVSLTFESSSFIPNNEMGTNEYALQLPWAFDFPAKSLKLSQVDFSTSKYWESVSMPPTHQILFEEVALRRVTCWVNRQQESLAGITFYTANDVDCAFTNLTLGSVGGTPIDFIISGTSGEHLVGLDAYFWAQRKFFAGIRLRTNWGRVGVFTGYTTHSTDIIHSQPLDITPYHEIVGLYAIQPDHLSDLPFLGVFTQPSSFSTIGNIIANTIDNINEPKEDQICTALDVSEYLAPWSDEPTCIPSISSPFYSLRTSQKLGHYATKAPVARIRRITCYKQVSTAGFMKYRHIIGLLLEYDTKGGSQKTPSSILLGRISRHDGVGLQKLVLDTNEGETITAIDKYERSPFGPEMASFISGLQIRTSLGRTISWGSIQAGIAPSTFEKPLKPTRLRVRVDDILRFDYNLFSSLLFVDGYHLNQS